MKTIIIIIKCASQMIRKRCSKINLAIPMRSFLVSNHLSMNLLHLWLIASVKLWETIRFHNGTSGLTLMEYNQELLLKDIKKIYRSLLKRH